MKKSDIVRFLSDETNVAESDIVTIIEMFLDQIKQGLETGERIKLHGFGSFYLQDRKARTAVDPRNQQPVIVPEKRVIRFQSARKLKQRIN